MTFKRLRSNYYAMLYLKSRLFVAVIVEINADSATNHVSLAVDMKVC